jgi:hypothetical protein
MCPVDLSIDPLDDWYAVKPWCRYFHSLLTDFSWIYRRVETVSMLDMETFDHSISLDINMKELRKRASDSGIPIESVDSFPIPIDTLRKGLLFEFDVTDQHGSAKSIVSRELDSRVAQYALLGQYICDFYNESDSVNELTLPNNLVNILYSIPENMETDDSVIKNGYSPQNWSADEKAEWHELLWNETSPSAFYYLLKRFMYNFPIVTFIDDDTDEMLVKYHFIEKQDNSLVSQGSFSTSRSFVFDNPRVGEAQRDHLHIIAPKGTEFILLPILEQQYPFSNNGVGSSEFFASVSPQSASIYSRIPKEQGFFHWDRYKITYRLRPAQNSYMGYYKFGYLLCFILVFLSLLWFYASGQTDQPPVTVGLTLTESLHDTSIDLTVMVTNPNGVTSESQSKASDGTDPMPIVTLLLLIPGFLLFQAWDTNTFDLGKLMLSGHRGLSSFLCFMLIISSGLLVLGSSVIPDVITQFCLVLTLLVSVFGYVTFSVSLHRSTRTRKAVLAVTGETRPFKPI